jgi:hypothetical protein
MNLSKSNSALFTRKDLLNVLFLVAIALIVFYPVFYTKFSYTDDFVQLWLYKTGSIFQPSIVYGRYVTEQLAKWLFSRAVTIHDVLYIRLFSFFGWLVCIPIWYIIIKKVVAREKLPTLLAFFSVLYLVCTPSFSIYVRWASCFEQFIAYTAGLSSGYILYTFMESESGKIHRPLLAIPGALTLGMVSLFTYQNGFGCFLLPFLLHVTSKPKKLKVILVAVAIYLSTYVVYYLLFKLNLQASHLESVNRTTISINPFPKIRFFFRPLASAFHFTFLFNERSVPGFVIYVVTFLAWVSADFYQSRGIALANRLKFLILTIFLLTIIYLPSLAVKENYFSNRTLLALNMGVFFLAANTILTSVKKSARMTVMAIISFLFVFNARYNFVQEFLNPVKTEYERVSDFIEKNYNSNVTTVYFIRPHEDFFVRKLGITRSWDEFGVPSTFFAWVPEFFTRQVIFEKTKSRKIAEGLNIKHWLGKEEFLKTAPLISPNTMLVDVEEILDHQ